MFGGNARDRSQQINVSGDKWHLKVYGDTEERRGLLRKPINMIKRVLVRSVKLNQFPLSNRTQNTITLPGQRLAGASSINYCIRPRRHTYTTIHNTTKYYINAGKRYCVYFRQLKVCARVCNVCIIGLRYDNCSQRGSRTREL